MPAATAAACDFAPEATSDAPAPTTPFTPVESGFFDAGDLIDLDPEAAAVAARIDADFAPAKASWRQNLWSDLGRVRRQLAIGACALFLLGGGVGVWAASAQPAIAVSLPAVAAAEPKPPAFAPSASRAPVDPPPAATTTTPKRAVVGPAHAARGHGKHARSHGARTASRTHRR